MTESGTKGDRSQASTSRTTEVTQVSVDCAPRRPRPPRSNVSTPSTQLSKALSYLLRHAAQKEGLPIRSDGYVPVKDVLGHKRCKAINMIVADAKAREESVVLTSPAGGSSAVPAKGKSKAAGKMSRSPDEGDLRSVVDENDKKRFELREEEGVLLIRAVQGHSIKEVTALEHVLLTPHNLSLLLPPDAPPDAEPTVLHGTTRSAWDLIRTSGGLSRMTRNHIHLAKGLPGESGVISGMRKSSPIIIHIDIRRALADGVPFWLAPNGAVLTAGELSSAAQDAASDRNQDTAAASAIANAETQTNDGAQQARSEEDADDIAPPPSSLDGVPCSGILPLRYVSKVELAKSGESIWTNETQER